jgi:hypothetical protein
MKASSAARATAESTGSTGSGAEEHEGDETDDNATRIAQPHPVTRTAGQ